MSGPVYEDQMDDNKAICPYCESSYQVECEDYDEDSRIEECGDCGMKYHLRQSFSVTHHTTPDCELNGVEHRFKRVGLFDVCENCDKCRSRQLFV